MALNKRKRATDFQNSTALSASPPAAQNLIFEREDWTAFRTVEGLQRKAGVAKDDLVRLVLKEITDNALDNGAAVRIGKLKSGNGWFAEDDGPGIDGTPEEIARLFSIARPMVSTKLLRLPTRGALGNGLRVVAGAVLASAGGFLTVITRNQRIELRPERAGSSKVVSAEKVAFPTGTRIEIGFGPALPHDILALDWADKACTLALGGQSYAGKSSPWWYDVPNFHELLTATGDRPVRELVAHLDGCTGGKAGEIVADAGLARALCKDVTAQQAGKLLAAARGVARPVKPQRLGAVGPEVFTNFSYAIFYGVTQFGSTMPLAEVPFVVEAWVEPIGEGGQTDVSTCVNRTPVTGDIETARDKRQVNIFGCGLSHTVAEAPKDEHFDVQLNITTPFVTLTSDGKEPDLRPFFDQITAAAGKAVRKAHRPRASASRVSQKDVVLDHLDEVIRAVSGEEGYRFNTRQIFYALRPILMDELGEELKLSNYTKIIDDYEAEHGEIPRMYREPRGSLYHPHVKETISLGTLMVEQYKRPVWTFNKLLYIEKEGFGEALKEVRWGERHDCAIMSSKGFSTRAARDLIDQLAEHDEPITVFCVHDADAAGSMIFQTLQEATKARGARKIEIINLGLEPWEALAMGLEVETLEASDKGKPVADYILAHDDDEWESWLQTHRVELNAMTTPRFITWLDTRLAGYGKLIPPPAVLEAELAARAEAKLRAAITERLLREARFEELVANALAALTLPPADVLIKGLENTFKHHPHSEWRDHIEMVARGKTSS